MCKSGDCLEKEARYQEKKKRGPKRSRIRNITSWTGLKTDAESGGASRVETDCPQ